MFSVRYAFLGILLTSLLSCDEQGKSRVESPEFTKKLDKQIDEQDLTIVHHRFEQDLFKLNKSTFERDTQALVAKYGSFVDLFSSKIIRVGSRNHPLFRQNVLGFIHDPDIRSVYEEVQRTYPDLDKEFETISTGLKRFHQLFPDTVVPQVYSMISGFNYNVVVADSVLGFGLDMYLGETCLFYEMLRLEKYKVARMNRAYLPADVVKGFVLAQFDSKSKHNDLISKMIYFGKIHYLCNTILPEVSFARFLGYSDEQLQWCKANESKIWSVFIDMKLFYSSDLQNEIDFINDGPFSKGFLPQGAAPARLGIWLGCQIVAEYMKNNPKVTLQDIMKREDAHLIFNQSGYKPGRI